MGRRILAGILLTGVCFAGDADEIVRELYRLAEMVMNKEKELLAIEEGRLDPVNLAIAHLEMAKRALQRIDYPVCGKTAKVNCIRVDDAVRDVEAILQGLYYVRSQAGALRIVTPDIEGKVKLNRLRDHERKLLEEAQEWAR